MLGDFRMLWHYRLNLLASNPPSKGGEPYWPIVLGIATILGAVLAIPPFLDWARGRRKRRALDKLLVSIVDRDDAERARQELQSIETLLTEARESIRRELPNEARRIFLENRRDSLAQSIGEEFSEYLNTTAELEKVGQQPGIPTTLSPTVVESIRESIEPLYTSRRREANRNRAIFAFILILLVAPYQFSPAGIVNNYLDTIFHASRYYLSYSLALTSIAGLVVSTVIAWGQVRAREKLRHKSIILMYVVPTGVAVVLGIACGLTLNESWNSRDYYSYDYNGAVDEQMGWELIGLAVSLGIVVALYVWPLLLRFWRRRTVNQRSSVRKLRPRGM
jgi:hypothetical protein